MYRFEPAAGCLMCRSSNATVLGRRLDRHQGLQPRELPGITTTVVRCDGCGLVYSNPRPVPEALAQHYDRPPEEYWQMDYFSVDPDYFGPVAQKFRELWSGTRRPRALDIGAGIGRAMAFLEGHGFDAFGLEPSPAFRDRAIADGISPERLQLARIEDVSFKPATFDFISMAAVLEHLQNPALAIERAVKWLAPKGLVYAEVPSARWLLGRILNATYRAQRLEFVTNLSPMHPPYHLYEFTLEAFLRHSELSGYEVAESQFYPCDTFLPRPVSILASWLMDHTGTGMQLEVWLRSRSSAAKR